MKITPVTNKIYKVRKPLINSLAYKWASGDRAFMKDAAKGKIDLSNQGNNDFYNLVLLNSGDYTKNPFKKLARFIKAYKMNNEFLTKCKKS